MARDSSGRDKLTMVVRQPLGPSPAPQARNNKQPLPDSNVRKLSPQEVLSSIRDFASGWNDRARDALGVNSDLNYMRNDIAGTVMFSKEKDFGITGVMADMEHGRISRPSTEYGMLFYSNGTGEYMVLADMSRRIVVREQIVNYHDKPLKKDWGIVVEAIDRAEKMAKANPGKVAVSDGSVFLV